MVVMGTESGGGFCGDFGPDDGGVVRSSVLRLFGADSFYLVCGNR